MLQENIYKEVFNAYQFHVLTKINVVNMFCEFHLLILRDIGSLFIHDKLFCHNYILSLCI